MTPKLRFQEFEDSWSQVTIAEAASFRRGSFPQPYNIPQWYDDVNGMPFVQVVDVGNDFRLKPKTKQMISELAMPKSVFVPKGSIVITIQGSIGRIALTQYDSYVDRTLLIITEKKLPLDDYFFIIALKKLFDFEKTIAVGGTIKTITKEKLAKFKFSLPHRSEQQRIGDFIRLVDQKINLLTKKKEALETYKKGLMQKIFSQELRFKREDGTDYPEWSQIKMSSFLSIPTDDNCFIPSESIVLTVRLHRKGIVKANVSSASKLAANYKYRRKGQLIFGKQNLFNGAIGLVPEEFDGYITSTDIPSLDINDEIICPEFLDSFFGQESYYKSLEKFAAGSGSKRIHEKTILNLKLAVPCIEEQQKIVKVIGIINKMANDLKSTLDLNRQFKKGLLQQMFV